MKNRNKDNYKTRNFNKNFSDSINRGTNGKVKHITGNIDYNGLKLFSTDGTIPGQSITAGSANQITGHLGDRPIKLVGSINNVTPYRTADNAVLIPATGTEVAQQINDPYDFKTITTKGSVVQVAKGTSANLGAISLKIFKYSNGKNLIDGTTTIASDGDRISAYLLGLLQGYQESYNIFTQSYLNNLSVFEFELESMDMTSQIKSGSNIIMKTTTVANTSALDIMCTKFNVDKYVFSFYAILEFISSNFAQIATIQDSHDYIYQNISKILTKFPHYKQKLDAYVQYYRSGKRVASRAYVANLLQSLPWNWKHFESIRRSVNKISSTTDGIDSPLIMSTTIDFNFPFAATTGNGFTATSGWDNAWRVLKLQNITDAATKKTIDLSFIPVSDAMAETNLTSNVPDNVFCSVAGLLGFIFRSSTDEIKSYLDNTYSNFASKINDLYASLTFVQTAINVIDGEVNYITGYTPLLPYYTDGRMDNTNDESDYNARFTIDAYISELMSVTYEVGTSLGTNSYVSSEYMRTSALFELSDMYNLIFYGPIYRAQGPNSIYTNELNLAGIPMNYSETVINKDQWNKLPGITGILSIQLYDRDLEDVSSTIVIDGAQNDFAKLKQYTILNEAAQYFRSFYFKYKYTGAAGVTTVAIRNFNAGIVMDASYIFTKYFPYYQSKYKTQAPVLKGKVVL